jgi:hypothetical protein
MAHLTMKILDRLAQLAPIKSIAGYFAAMTTVIIAMLADSYLIWPFVLFVGTTITYTTETWATAHRNHERINYIDDDHIQ